MVGRKYGKGKCYNKSSRWVHQGLQWKKVRMFGVVRNNHMNSQTLEKSLTDSPTTDWYLGLVPREMTSNKKEINSTNSPIGRFVG